MGSKKKKGSKVNMDSNAGAVQPAQPDMSKYANAYSNKSKINYAELKLVRSDQPKTTEKSDSTKGKKKPSRLKSKPGKTAKKVEVPKGKNKKKQNKPAAKHPDKAAKDRKNETKVKSSETSRVGITAEERYSNALGKEDHYSSAVEKYYLKYPDAKRKKKTASTRRNAEVPKKKKKCSSRAGETGPSKRSMAEIAVMNKSSSSVKEHARAARNAKARGVVSPKVANRSFYRPKKKRSGALNVLMVTLLLVFLASVGVTVFFNVRQINVAGDSPYSVAQIKNVCGITKGRNILFINTDDLEKKVERELPYIAECSIDRRLPSTVTINVKKADVLGVAQAAAGQWTVLSTDGKILETATNLTTVSADDVVGTPTYTPEYGSAAELAESRKLPVLAGLAVKDNVTDGFITDHTVLGHINRFVNIKNAFERVKMKLTSISYGERGYEAEYDKRIVVIFGKETDEKTVVHRMEELHALIFDNGYIAENDMGEVRFNKKRVYFRHAYEVSEEELEKIREERRKTNRDRLYSMAEIFMNTGFDWYEGRLETE